MIEKLEQHLNQILDDIEKKLKTLFDRINTIDKRTNILESYISSPDKIESGVLNNLFDGSITNSKEFKQAINFIGLYAEYSEESQIISSRDYLSKILNKKISLLNDLLNETTPQIDALEKIKVKTLQGRELIEKCKEERHLTKQDINNLYDLIIEYGVNDETLEFFVEIAQNNLRLSLDEKKAEVSEKPEKGSIPEIPTPEATIDPEVMLAERTEEQQEKVEELSNTREDLIKMLGLLEEKNYFSKEHPELEGKLRYIFKDYINRIQSMSEDDFDVLQYTIEIEEGLDLADETVFYETLCINILKAIRNNEYNKIKEFINKYLVSPYISREDFFYLSDIPQAVDILKNAEKYLVSDEKLQNVRSIMNGGYDLDYALKALNSKNAEIDEKEYLSYEISLLYEEVLYRENSLITEEEKIELLSILKSLAAKTNELENIINELSNSNDSLVEEEKIVEDSDNYIVFLDPEAFDTAINELKRTYYDVTFNQAINAVNNVIQKDPNELNQCKNIHVSPGKRNSYEIQEERSGALRLGFKRINNAEVSGKPVYLILSIGYGNADGMKKYDELKKNITLFEREYAQYKKIEQTFAKEKNVDGLCQEAEDYIQQSREVIEGLKSKAKKNSDSSSEGGRNL